MVVDDEPLSQEVIMQFIADTPGLELTRVEADAIGALEFLQENEIDLIFLDINMPKLSGLNFARSLDNPPMIIFTTAYPEFAVEGFDLEAVDYLVKPVPFERFLKAANKALEQFRFRQEGNRSEPLSRIEEEPTHLTVKSDKKIYRISLSDISYFESIGDYIKIHTTNNVIITAHTLKDMEAKLDRKFTRIHKSFIVSLSAISYMEGNMVRVGEKSIPIGSKYKEDFFAKFRSYDTP